MLGISTYPWTTEPPEIDLDTEGTKDFTGVPAHSSHLHTTYREPYWDKRFLPILYKDISAKNIVFDKGMVKQLENMTTTTIKTHIYSFDGKKTLTHIFE